MCAIITKVCRSCLLLVGKKRHSLCHISQSFGGFVEQHLTQRQESIRKCRWMFRIPARSRSQDYLLKISTCSEHITWPSSVRQREYKVMWAWRKLHNGSLGSLACSASELTSESMNPFRHFGRTPWTGNSPITGPPPTQESATQNSVNIYPCLEGCSNLRF